MFFSFVFLGESNSIKTSLCFKYIVWLQTPYLKVVMQFDPKNTKIKSGKRHQKLLSIMPGPGATLFFISCRYNCVVLWVIHVLRKMNLQIMTLYHCRGWWVCQQALSERRQMPQPGGQLQVYLSKQVHWLQLWDRYVGNFCHIWIINTDLNKLLVWCVS